MKRKREFIIKEYDIEQLKEDLLFELKRLRKKEHLSQKELSKIAKINQPQIAKIETGKRSPNLSTILKIIGPLGKTLTIIDKE